MKRYPLITLFLFIALAACDEKPNKPYKPPVPQTGENKPDAGVFEPQRQALEKAKGLDATLQQQSQQQQEAVENASK